MRTQWTFIPIRSNIRLKYQAQLMARGLFGGNPLPAPKRIANCALINNIQWELNQNIGILLIRNWRPNFSDILSEIHTFSFGKIHFKISSTKLCQLCPDINVLTSVTGEKGFNDAAHPNCVLCINFLPKLQVNTSPMQFYDNIFSWQNGKLGYRYVILWN